MKLCRLLLILLASVILPCFARPTISLQAHQPVSVLQVSGHFIVHYQQGTKTSLVVLSGPSNRVHLVQKGHALMLEESADFWQNLWGSTQQPIDVILKTPALSRIALSGHTAFIGKGLKTQALSVQDNSSAHVVLSGPALTLAHVFAQHGSLSLMDVKGQQVAFVLGGKAHVIVSGHILKATIKASDHALLDATHLVIGHVLAKTADQALLLLNSKQGLQASALDNSVIEYGPQHQAVQFYAGGQLFLSSFSAVHVAGNIDLHLVQAQEPRLLMQDKNLLNKHIFAKIIHHTLWLNMTDAQLKDAPVVTLELPALHQLSVVGAASVSGHDLDFNDLSILASGQSKVFLDGMLSNVSVVARQAGHVRLEWVRGQYADATVSQEAGVKFAGMVKVSHLSAVDKGSINAPYLRVNHALVSASDFSLIKLSPVDSLHAFASDRSNILLYKRPAALSDVTSQNANVLQVAWHR